MPRVTGRQHEGGLGEIGFARNRLHGAIREALGVRKNGELVAGEGPVGKDIGNDEAVWHRRTRVA